MSSVTTAQYHGTALALIRTRQFIAVAADSKVTSIAGELRDTLSCKIRYRNGVYIAINGLVSAKNGEWNVGTILEEALDTTASLWNILAQADLRIRRSLPGILAEQYAALGADRFAKLYVGSQVTGLILFGFTPIGPYIIDYSYYVHVRNGIPDSISLQALYVPPHSNEIFHASVPGSATTTYLQSNPCGVDVPEFVAVKLFVSHAISIHPDECGGPVDHLLLLRAGPIWIQRKQNCIESLE